MKTDYTTYDAEALAQDATFIAWVKDGDHAQAWADWIAAHPDQEEKVAYAKALLEAIDFKEESPSTEQTERMWANIQQSTRETADVEARVVPLWERPRAWMGAAAAVAALVIAVWWLLQTGGAVSVTTQVAELQTVGLPDGSTVQLNAASTVTFNRESWRNKRAIQLSGEAFFEVTKGTRFTVTTDYGEVEVLGTSFNVEARPQAFAVHCFTGKVRVSHGKEAMILNPGKGTRLQQGQLQALQFEGEEIAAWRTGMHTFDTAPLAEVFAALERQYGYQVAYPSSVAERPYSGFFESGDLEKALQSVCWPLDLQFDIDKDRQRVIVTE